MRATLIYKALIIGFLPIASALCTVASLLLSFSGSLPVEKAGFMALALISALVFLWATTGLAIAGYAVLIARSTPNLQKLWIFRPIFFSVLGTTALATPAQATDVVVTSVDSTPTPFFTDMAEEEEDPQIFFAGESEPQKVSENMKVEFVPVDFQRTQPSQHPDIFFRSLEPETPIDQQPGINQHTVVRGDTLWDIARTSLPPDATPGEILQQTYKIYEKNTDQLTSIDSLIHAGQILQIPNPNE